MNRYLIRFTSTGRTFRVRASSASDAALTALGAPADRPTDRVSTAIAELRQVCGYMYACLVAERFARPPALWLSADDGATWLVYQPLWQVGERPTMSWAVIPADQFEHQVRGVSTVVDDALRALEQRLAAQEVCDA